MTSPEIVGVAESIGTYEESIADYKDCCSIVSRHPRTRMNVNNVLEASRKYDFPALAERPSHTPSVMKFDARTRLVHLERLETPPRLKERLSSGRGFTKGKLGRNASGPATGTTYPLGEYYKVLEGFDIHKSSKMWEAVVVVEDQQGRRHMRLYKWIMRGDKWKVDSRASPSSTGTSTL